MRRRYPFRHDPMYKQRGPESNRRSKQAIKALDTCDDCRGCIAFSFSLPLSNMLPR